MTDREGPRLVIAQRALRGPVPSTAKVADFLSAACWDPLPGMAHAWVSHSRRIAIFDTRAANFILMGDTPIPFDVIPVPIDDIGL